MQYSMWQGASQASFDETSSWQETHRDGGLVDGDGRLAGEVILLKSARL
jgi:hypothetical protein